MINHVDPDFVWIHFRGGDIAVGYNSGKLGEKEVSVFNFLGIADDRSIGSDVNPKDSQLVGPKVRLTFFDPKSIDVVIRGLKKAKKSLIKRTEVPNEKTAK